MNNKGFTLIELLVVIAIIGLLSSVVVASLNSARGRAADARRIAELKQLQLAIEAYAIDTGSYLSNGHYGSAGGDCGFGNNGEFSELFAPLVEGGYLPAIPVDPQDPTRCYQYSRYTPSLPYTGGGTAWRCDNGAVNPNEYEYFLQFYAGESTFSLPTSDQGNWTYCLLGPRRVGA